jgi:Cyclic nucleotide-binding domain
MEPFDYDFDRPGTWIELELLDRFDGLISTALLSVFRGKFCDAVLPNRKARTYRRDQAIYDVGDKDGTLFFLRSGFVKVGTITFDGHELIYDVRTAGDVVGELCASEEIRPDRAVALEQSEAGPVPFAEMVDILRDQPQLMARLESLFCHRQSGPLSVVASLIAEVPTKIRTSWHRDDHSFSSGIWTASPAVTNLGQLISQAGNCSQGWPDAARKSIDFKCFQAHTLVADLLSRLFPSGACKPPGSQQG